ncbi:MAG: hypothetical protein EON91_10060 [Brevundimonas sp.]|uniref:sensor histidine kinase n=1 Tax=Brevundimonas sp. TaxID=1871086 RepID=UPI001207D47B|nr:histidine kinase [Brevundimonas sp.]RZJ17219.1 MAG: hypothetical protein EON91_10060 [Brevundimonas sp.]
MTAQRGERRLQWLALAIWTGFILLETLIDPGILPMAIVWAAHGLLLMMLLRVGLERAPSRGGARLAVFLVAPIAAAFLQTILDFVATRWIGEALLRGLTAPPPGYVVSPIGLPPLLVFKISLRSYLWIFSLYAAAVALLAVTRNESRAREDVYAARLKAQRAELDALRLQVNPHFLFNALNGLASVANRERAGEIERMALGLARFYRGSFVEIDRETLPLSEELENAQAFLELESLRLDKLAFHLDCPDDLLGAPVPAMILQPLVENAVKYGVAGHDDPPPIRIMVREMEGRIELVCESGLSPYPDPPGTGSGLVNVRRRLENAFGPAGTVFQEHGEDRWRVTLTLPRAGVGEPVG